MYFVVFSFFSREATFFSFYNFFLPFLFNSKIGAYQQAKKCFEIIENAIKQLGGSGTQNLVRTRLFVTDIR
jgi:hypothetical protein